MGISAQCFTHPTSKSGKSYINGEQSDKVDSAPVMHTRVLLLPPEATRLSQVSICGIEERSDATHWCLKGISRVTVKDLQA